MSNPKKSNKITNIILAAVMLLCFAAAGYMAWLYFGEMQTRSEAGDTTAQLREIALATATDTAAPTATVSAGEASSATAGEAATAQPTATAEPVEPEDEEIDEDDELNAYLYAARSGSITSQGTPEPTAAPAATATATPTVKPEAGQTGEAATATPKLTPVRGTPTPAVTATPSAETATSTPAAAAEVTATSAPLAEATAVNATAEATASPVAAADMTPTPVAEAEATAAPTEEPTATPTATPIQVGTSVVEDAARITVDFGYLEQTNPDIRGWLYQEGTEINYPVMQHTDNEYYLTHLFDGKTNKSGCIFMDCGNSYYFGDIITYLYGHNRNDGTMFASLPNYMSQEYWEEHPTMLLITPYENYQVQIFACTRRSLETEEDWRMKQFDSRVDFEAAVADILEESGIDTGIVPEWGDQLLALGTCTNEVHIERYLVYAVLRPIVYATDESVAVEKMELDAIEGTSRVIDVPGRGPTQYYAQNDPVWANMLYEPKGSTHRGTMASSACGPTAMAMIVANMVDPQYYWYLDYYSGLEDGLTFCSNSVNQYYCDHSHAQYRLQTAEEFTRYMPVALASFATGNNRSGLKSRGLNGGGTKTTFMGQVAEIFGLDMDITKSRADLLETLSKGGMAIASTGGSGTPYTGGGHYMTVVAADDEYLYVMDPYMKEDYSKTDKRHVIEVIEPGLIRLKLSDWKQLALYTFYTFNYKPY